MNSTKLNPQQICWLYENMQSCNWKWMYMHSIAYHYKYLWWICRVGLHSFMHTNFHVLIECRNSSVAVVSVTCCPPTQSRSPEWSRGGQSSWAMSPRTTLGYEMRLFGLLMCMYQPTNQCGFSVILCLLFSLPSAVLSGGAQSRGQDDWWWKGGGRHCTATDCTQ